MRYQVFSSGVESENNRLEIINEYIRESQSTDFTGRWALLAEWSDVHPYNHLNFVNFPFFFQGETADFLSSVSQYCVNIIPFIIFSIIRAQTNTFQAIIITDVFTTYVIYTYKCGELEWTGPDFRHAVVGYNIPGAGFRNEPLSATSGIHSIACRNQPFSDIVNIVYPFESNPGMIIFYMLCII